MAKEFRINKINAKEEIEFRNKINAIKTQLVVTTGTNLFQHRVPRNLELSHVPIVSYSVEKD